MAFTLKIFFKFMRGILDPPLFYIYRVCKTGCDSGEKKIICTYHTENVIYIFSETGIF